MEVLEKIKSRTPKSAIGTRGDGYRDSPLTYRIEPRVMSYDYVRKRFATGEHPFENHAAPLRCIQYERMKCRLRMSRCVIHTSRRGDRCLQRIVDLLKLGL
jgi:hypothetical protein